MDAYKRVDKALCVYGEIKRTKTTGGDQTREFVAKVTAAMGELSTDEQLTVQSLYILQMTLEEAAEATDCDPSTISRRKRRALERLALLMYPDQYIQDKGLHG